MYKSRKNQILCHEIEPNPLKDRAMHEEDNPSLSWNLQSSQKPTGLKTEASELEVGQVKIEN
jgi:hypothetical protein